MVERTGISHRQDHCTCFVQALVVRIVSMLLANAFDLDGDFVELVLELACNFVSQRTSCPRPPQAPECTLVRLRLQSATGKTRSSPIASRSRNRSPTAPLRRLRDLPVGCCVDGVCCDAALEDVRTTVRHAGRRGRDRRRHL